ncbi:hypothetical protein, partial [Jeotgalibaca porci]|uniref:hypothetical protein n=1 Tax=Jeotgalibaca porci TaxID=1868793 RepID=UPI00359FCED6
MVTTERLNHIENGIANSADKAEVTAQLQQTDGRVSTIIANAGDGTLPSEVVDMRTVGAKTYTVAGEALRSVAEGRIPSSSKLLVAKVQKNKIDISKLIAGAYVNYLSGATIPNANNFYLDFIELLPNTMYTYSIQDSSPNVVEQFALYSSNTRESYTRGFVGGVQFVTFTTSETERFVRLTVSNARKAGLQLETGPVMTPYEPYRVAVDSDKLGKAITLSNLTDE